MYLFERADELGEAPVELLEDGVDELDGELRVAGQLIGHQLLEDERRQRRLCGSRSTSGQTSVQRQKINHILHTHI